MAVLAATLAMCDCSPRGARGGPRVDRHRCATPLGHSGTILGAVRLKILGAVPANGLSVQCALVPYRLRAVIPASMGVDGQHAPPFARHPLPADDLEALAWVVSAALLDSAPDGMDSGIHFLGQGTRRHRAALAQQGRDGLDSFNAHGQLIASRSLRTMRAPATASPDLMAFLMRVLLGVGGFGSLHKDAGNSAPSSICTDSSRSM